MATSFSAPAPSLHCLSFVCGVIARVQILQMLNSCSCSHWFICVSVVSGRGNTSLPWYRVQKPLTVLTESLDSGAHSTPLSFVTDIQK